MCNLSFVCDRSEDVCYTDAATLMELRLADVVIAIPPLLISE